MANASGGILGGLIIKLGQRIESHDFERAKELLPEIQRRAHTYESEANYAYVRYLASKTPINVKRDGKSSNDFDNWQKMITDPLKREAGATRSSFFRFVMDQMLGQRPGFKKVPLIYYDFYSEKAVYTPGALDLFVIDQETADKIPLKVLARRFIAEEERKMLTDELKSGNRIKDYNLRTSYSNLGQVLINAYPLLYERKPVGFGVLLYSPELNPRISQQRYAVFEKGVEELIGRIAKEFQIIREGSRNL